MIEESPNKNDANNPNQNMFGLGCMQWTNYSRIKPLIECYIKVSGSDGRIRNKEQVIQAEIEHLVTELTGEGDHTGPNRNGDTTKIWGFDLPDLWKRRNADNINSSAAARSAGELINSLLQRPSDENEPIRRGNWAVSIFNVMTGS
jgi:hypothetical protein